jgi:glycosyltransferase involved in cell wall biosynthesis
MSMRVALITENFLPKLDGVTRTLAMLLEHLERRGHRVIVMGPDSAPRHYAGARVFGARGLPLPFYPELRALVPPPEFERILQRFRPDIVHVVEPMALGAMGIVWGQRMRAPLISSYHTNLAAYCAHFHLSALQQPVWAYRRRLHNQCARTLCPSPSTLRELERHGFARLGVWGRGVDTWLFTPARRSRAWREQVAGDPERPIVLYVGRLSHEKNLAVLVQASTRIQAAGARLVLVGDGPARVDLERALAGQPVTFTGYLRGEALATAYASADIFAFPSETETFGQVSLEAMASGLPVVAFDAEGVRDLVRDGESGRLAPRGEMAAFTAAVAALLAQPGMRRALGERAHLLALARTWEQAMDGLLAHYEEVMAAHAVAEAV